MEYIGSLFLLVLVLLNFRFSKQISFSLGTIFLIYWLLIVVGGIFHFYGLYNVSDSVYLLVLSGCFSFFIGYNSSPHAYADKNVENDDVITTGHQTLSFKHSFYIVLIFALLIICKQVLLLLPVILSHGMADARGEMQLDDSLVLSGGLDTVLAYFAKPFVKATLVVFIVNSIKAQFSYKNVVLILVCLGIYFFSEGGRAVVMDIFFTLLYALYKFRKKISSKSKKKIKKAIALIAILPIWATLQRGSDVLFSIYTYYCGCLQYLSISLQQKADIFNDHLWGLASFQGFIKPIVGILQIFGFDKPEQVQKASDFIMVAQTTVYDIAPKCEMNYFFTTFGYSYKDGGYVGNMIIHFIYGAMCKFVDLKDKFCSDSIRWISIKAVFFYCILFSMSYFPFGMYLHAMTIIFIFIITSNVFTQKTKYHITHG